MSAEAKTIVDGDFNAFRKAARATPVSNLVTPNRRIVTVCTDDDVVAAFQHIVKHKILSAPVLDKATGEYIGFLDTRDLVQYVVFNYEEKKKAESRAANTLQVPPVDLRKIFDAAARLHDNPVNGITVTYLARRNKFNAVKPSDSILRVVELMSLPSVHRVAVVAEDSKNQIIDIISQSSIVAWIYSHKDDLKEELSKTVDEVKLGSRPVIPVNDTDTALATFKVMAQHNRSGIAVVNANGRFLGNTSGSDLKLFIQNPEQNMATLESPIMDFLSAIRRAEITEKTRSPTITSRPDATVDRVVGRLAATKIHRVFVAADENGFKPEAVISLTDLLRYLLSYGGSPAVTVERS